jgi:hypothetical protein
LIELPTDFNPTVVVNEFVESTAATLTLPASLTSTERSEMHHLAQHLGLEHVSRGVAENRFLTLAKPGVIVGEPTLRKTMSSELIVQAQESQVIPSASNIAEILATAPAQCEDVYSMEDRPEPKKRGRKPGSKKTVVAVDAVDAVGITDEAPRYNTRSRNKI